MTWTVTHPDSRASRHAGAGTIRWPRGLGALGLFTVLFSAWGGIVPYLGPTWGYSADGSSAWQWSLSHSLLYLVPGAVGVLAGLAVMARAGGGRWTTRVSLAFWGLLLVACGAWFVLGPSAWPVLEHGQVFTSTATAMNHFVDEVGFNLGVGVVIATLGGMVLKASTGEREIPIGGAAVGDAAMAAPMTATPAEAPLAAPATTRPAGAGEGPATVAGDSPQ